MGERLYFERFLWFDGEIRRGRFPNATHPAEQFECSVKTAQRTIEFFRDRMAAPLEYEPARRGYFYLDPEFRLPIACMNENELVVLLASRKLLTDASTGPVGEELGRVSAKLGALLSDHLPGRVDPEQAFSFRWHSFSPSDPLIFTHIVNSLLHCRLISFCYYSPLTRSCTARTVEPHHMVNYMGTWHVVAYCRLRGDWRDFHISRITLCKLEDEAFITRPDAEWRPFLEDTFGIFQNRDRFEVVLEFSSERSRWVRGEVWHPERGMEELETGGLRLTVPVSHEAEIMMEVLKHGSHVEVIEPGWLREKVKEEIDRMEKVYGVGHEMGEVGV